MHSTSAIQIPDAAKTLLGQFKAIHQVQTLEPVGPGFTKAIDEAARDYPVAQRFVLTGVGELGQFTKEAASTAGKMVNNLKIGACIARRMGGRPETEEGANWVVKAVVNDPKGAEREMIDVFDACYSVQENGDVIPALKGGGRSMVASSSPACAHIQLGEEGECFYDLSGPVHSLEAFMLSGPLSIKVLQELFYEIASICFFGDLFYA